MVVYPTHLKKTLSIALLVGTVLFCVNRLGVVLRGDATALVWGKVAVTYAVPFANSSAGILIASRTREEPACDPRIAPQ